MAERLDQPREVRTTFWPRPRLAPDSFGRIAERIAESKHSSGLNVLKRFGAGNPAPLSFPQPGWTVTVDFPVTPGLHRFCDELDELEAVDDPESDGGMRKGSALGGSGWQTSMGPAPFVAWAISVCAVMWIGAFD